MKDIYRKYFQKSFNFLYPLLGFSKNKFCKPHQTFIEWEGVYTKDDKKLICVYKRNDSEQWKEFEKSMLIEHEMLDCCIPIDDKIVVYVFDLNTFRDDYEHFLNGRYSKMSKLAKQRITSYYGIHTPEWVFMESYIFPESYFEKYSEILSIDVEILKRVGELCEVYTPEKEICTIKHPETHII